MPDFTLPHRRYNPLADEWILVSPQRAKRPWNGKIESVPPPAAPDYDPACYLCPGNMRASGVQNPRYSDTFVFTNDHPALMQETDQPDNTPPTPVIPERGLCRVICYSPSHKLTMANLTGEQTQRVIETWTEEYLTIGKLPYISHVQIFENKGALMGASNPHPHGQIWATEHLPTLIAKEEKQQAAYRTDHASTLLLDYLAKERKDGRRLLYKNRSFAVLVPFWATWPYETMILPRHHLPSLPALTISDRKDLAQALNRVTRAYDGLFETPFPYSMGIHQAPTNGTAQEAWELHIHFYPPLLRSATVKKYFVGYEMFAEAQRDISPEEAAQTLRTYYG